MKSLLNIEDLSIGFKTSRGIVLAVDGVDMEIKRNETVGLVGESGCGKSTLARAIPRVLPSSARIASGKVLFKEQDILRLSDTELRKIRGTEMGMIFQDPTTYLNPVMKVGDQVAEKVLFHETVDKEEARSRALRTIQEMLLPDPETIFDSFPHELSGGMRQRIMIAIALVNCDSLLIADEPTTSLDVTIQLEIIQLMKRLQKKHGISLLFVTHDLSIIGAICDRVYVMYAGKIVESGYTEQVFTATKHPYTKGLLMSNASLTDPEREYHVIRGVVPDLADPPPGCRFHPRCPHATKKCREREPPDFRVEGQKVACWLYEKTPS